jgi:hypothetical protein
LNTEDFRRSMRVAGPLQIGCRFRTRFHRYFSCTRPSTDSAVPTKQKNYAHTLLLPRTDFPLWTDPEKSEPAFRKKSCDDLYRWQVVIFFIRVPVCV